MARIRTIKPEFWQNEEIASLSEHARLLAIALLNFCDDEGFFLANPSLVRANCFPFQEDSRNVPGSLQELSRIGYVEVRDCSGKAIGRVVKFLSHQRIEKAQKSKLAPLFLQQQPTETQENNSDLVDSVTVPGTFQDDSRSSHGLERKGKEQGKERKGEENGNVLAPAFAKKKTFKKFGTFGSRIAGRSTNRFRRPRSSNSSTSLGVLTEMRQLQSFDSPLAEVP